MFKAFPQLNNDFTFIYNTLNIFNTEMINDAENIYRSQQLIYSKSNKSTDKEFSKVIDLYNKLRCALITLNILKTIQTPCNIKPIYDQLKVKRTNEIKVILGHMFLICDIDTERAQINKVRETIVKSITIKQIQIPNNSYLNSVIQ